MERDALWGRVLWDWLKAKLPDAGLLMEIDTEDLLTLAEKHGRAKREIFNEETHAHNIEAEEGDEIWTW